MAHESSRSTAEILVQGMGVSPGVAVGPVFLMGSDAEPVASRTLAPARIEAELRRFDTALAATRAQIQKIQRDVRERIGHQDADILDVHLMVLDDKVFIGEIRDEIGLRRHNVEYAVWLVSDRYAGVLARIDDDYLRERTADVRDVARRLLRNLGDQKEAPLDQIPHGSIIVAENLAPSDTALLRREFTGGIATDYGSAVSHTAIMARALEIPAVVALHEISRQVQPGETILIDGNSGIVVIRPTAGRLKAYNALMSRRQRLHVEIVERVRNLPALTADDIAVSLRANIDGPAELDDVIKHGGEGIGLFRSESLFLGGARYAAESEQVGTYVTMAARLKPQPVTVRTLDIGGDKILSGIEGVLREDNPFLGCRGIRLCLADPGMFKTQLRAIALAVRDGAANLRIMYPMISDIDELRRANEFWQAERDAVANGSPFPAPAVGAMIETPAAALCARDIAAHVDFISIGSNDLVQYTMAADRGNDRVAHLYQPTHPAVLRLIEMTVAAAADAGIPVAVCGEMAGNPLLTPLLIGMGLTELSMVPAAIPVVKAVARAVRMDAARRLAAAARASRSGAEVLDHCREWLRAHAPDVLEWIE